MNPSPSRSGPALLLVSAGLMSVATLCGQTPESLVAPVGSANGGATRSTDLAHTDTKGRHLAPHDTFYLLSYVSAQTDKGVEGFEPGQEVRLVEVHRPTQTLVVTDGRASVEVAPSKLTNDMDVAAAVKLKDESSQARIAAYIQAEQTAYQNYEKTAADATAKDLEKHNQEQAASSTIGQDTKADQPAQQVDANVGGNGGYYNEGSYGYGSPYSYFSGDNVVVVRNPAATGAQNTGGTAAGPAAPPGKVSAPGGAGGGGGKRGK